MLGYLAGMILFRERRHHEKNKGDRFHLCLVHPHFVVREIILDRPQDQSLVSLKHDESVLLRVEIILIYAQNPCYFLREYKSERPALHEDRWLHPSPCGRLLSLLLSYVKPRIYRNIDIYVYALSKVPRSDNAT